MSDIKNSGGSAKELLSKTLDLKALIDYQDGAVVSRTLIDKGEGTVTLFAFDEGQGLSEHTAPFDAMVQVIDGNAEINIASQQYNISAGQMIIMPADKPHSLKAPEKFKMILTMIRSGS
ncbi:MAG: cupin domain-containing protein [Candidatus Omnitrophota bacterium]